MVAHARKVRPERKRAQELRTVAVSPVQDDCPATLRSVPAAAPWFGGDDVYEERGALLWTGRDYAVMDKNGRCLGLRSSMGAAYDLLLRGQREVSFK